MITLSIAQIVACTEAEGPGKRRALVPWLPASLSRLLQSRSSCRSKGGEMRSLNDMVAEVKRVRASRALKELRCLAASHLPTRQSLASARSRKVLASQA